MIQNLKQFLSIVAMALIVCGCDNNSDMEIDVSPRSINGLTQTDKDIEHSLRSFSFKMLKSMAEAAEASGYKNVVYSPFSVNQMLSMVALGAEGETLDQILEATGLNRIENATRTWADHYRLLNGQICGLDPSASLHMASGVWTLPGENLNHDFKATVEECFKAKCASADLGSDKGISQINGWIERNTGGMIRDLIPSGYTGKVLLANAMNFEGRWRYPFDKSRTHTDDFLNADGNIAKVNMMDDDVKAYIGFDKRLQCKYATLLFGNTSFVMNIYLTDGDHPASDLIPAISDSLWCQYPKKYQFSYVNVKMPRFEIDERPGLNAALENCGMTRLISDPELGKIIDSEIRSMSFVHGATFKATENGVKAAATTGEALDGCLPPFTPDEDLTFIKINRPFVFVVHEWSSGAILTMGCINKL